MPPEGTSSRERGAARGSALAVLVLVVAGSAVLLSSSRPASAQEFRRADEEKPDARKKKKGPLGLDVGLGVEYDSNPWLFSPDTLKDLRRDRAADETSGRFDDVSSEDDVILRAGAAGSLRVGKKKGSRFRAEAEPRARWHFLNPRLSHVDVRALLAQEVSRSSEVRLSGSYTPTRFRRNAMADAVDTDGNGSISDDERRYRPVRYAEGEARLAFAFEFGEKGTSEAQVFAGVSARAHRRPFADRDEVAPEAGIEAVLRSGAPGGTALGYRLVWTRDEPSREVLILDEDDYDVDFNGDGDTLDQDARTRQRVDRSSLDHHAHIGILWGRRDAVNGGLRFELRVRQFLSGERYDRDHRTRWDLRPGVRFALEFPLGRGTSLGIGVFGEVQDSLFTRKDFMKWLNVDYLRWGGFAAIRAGV